MKTIIVSVSTGYVGSKKEIEFEVGDEATEDEINEIALETMLEMIDWSWWEKDKGTK